MKLGASLTGVPVTALAPLTDRAPSDTLVAIVKLALKFSGRDEAHAGQEGVDVGDRADAVHTPVPGT